MKRCVFKNEPPPKEPAALLVSLREDIKKCGLQKNSQTDFIVSMHTGIGRTTLRYVLPVVVLSPLPQLRAPPLPFSAR